jgi:hypothetical protein
MEKKMTFFYFALFTFSLFFYGYHSEIISKTMTKYSKKKILILIGMSLSLLITAIATFKIGASAIRYNFSLGILIYPYTIAIILAGIHIKRKYFST